jgi:single-strand DNA-binding protein
MNRVILTGFVAQDTKTFVSKGGMNYTRIRLGVPTHKKDVVNFFDIVAWDKKSDFAEKYLKKGKNIAVFGRLEPFSYEKDGIKTYGINIVAEEFEFLFNEQNKEQPTSLDVQKEIAQEVFESEPKKERTTDDTFLAGTPRDMLPF